MRHCCPLRHGWDLVPLPRNTHPRNRTCWRRSLERRLALRRVQLTPRTEPHYEKKSVEYPWPLPVVVIQFIKLVKLADLHFEGSGSTAERSIRREFFVSAPEVEC